MSVSIYFILSSLLDGITYCLLRNEMVTAVHEFHEKNEWWLNELGSLGVRVNKTNEFNDVGEISNLANMLKRHYFADFKSVQCGTD
jgi:hypothetical protein